MATNGVERDMDSLNMCKNSRVTRRGPSTEHGANITLRSSSIASTADQCNCAYPTTSHSSSFPIKYAKLISIINQVNSEDRDILMDQKLEIIDAWTTDCPESTQVKDSLKYIYQKSLEDEAFAMKVVSMVASNAFLELEISRQKIRWLFTQHIQHTYRNSKLLQKTNPNSFRIAVRLLSEFYNKAKLSNGNRILTLVAPLIHYFKMLLKSSEPEDIQLFTSRLCLNATAIGSTFPKQLTDVLCSVKKTLINNVQLTENSKVFLMLVVDFAHNSFEFLPQEIMEFYQKELGDKIIGQLQYRLGPLSVQNDFAIKLFDKYITTINKSPNSNSSIDTCCCYTQHQSHWIKAKSDSGLNTVSVNSTKT